MKKVFFIAVFLVAACTVTTKISAQTKADTTANIVLQTTSAAATTIDATLNNAGVDFGNATEFKDSVAAVLKSASTDPQVGEIKDKTIELVEIGQQVKSGNKLAIAPLILGILSVIGLLVAYLVGHFGVFKKKQQ